MSPLQCRKQLWRASLAHRPPCTETTVKSTNYARIEWSVHTHTHLYASVYYVCVCCKCGFLFHATRQFIPVASWLSLSGIVSCLAYWGKDILWTTGLFWVAIPIGKIHADQFTLVCCGIYRICTMELVHPNADMNVMWNAWIYVAVLWVRPSQGVKCYSWNVWTVAVCIAWAPCVPVLLTGLLPLMSARDTPWQNKGVLDLDINCQRVDLQWDMLPHICYMHVYTVCNNSVVNSSPMEQSLMVTCTN